MLHCKKTGILLTVLSVLLASTSWLFARPVTENEIHDLVSGWLRADSCPLGEDMTGTIADITIYNNDGYPFSIVMFSQGAAIMVAGNDQLEPVIAFVDSYDPLSPGADIMLEFIARDIKYRSELAGLAPAGKDKTSSTKAGEPATPASIKWSELIARAAEPATKAGYQVNISSPRVYPLLTTKWSQHSHDNTTGGLTCYNNYTPNNYPSGCVATAMAQIIKFWQYPQTGVSGTFTIRVNGSAQNASLLGGTLPGGAYDYSLMPDQPSTGVTLAQRQEIGRLCHDTGAAVGMSYTAGASSASLSNASSALTSVFGFVSSKYAADDVYLSDSLLNIINPNLDAGWPVILGILDSVSYSGHAVVADGYGYNYGTLYHHINMGWGGYADLWYNLPDISYGSQNYDLITDCIYNISPTITGEIVSGRVTDEFGNPLANVTVTADDGSNSYTATTNLAGIYAFTNLTSNTQYVLTGTANGYAVQFYIMSRHVTTSQSGAYDDIAGNVLAPDLIAWQMPQNPLAIAQELSVTSGQSINLTLQCDDDGYLDPIMTGEPTMVLTKLPARGQLSIPGSGPINSVPCDLTACGGQLLYTHSGISTGIDDFAFVAHDNMGASSAVVTINIPDLSQGFESGYMPGWSFTEGSTPPDGIGWNYYYITNTPKSSWSGNIAAMCISYNGTSPNDSLVYSSLDTQDYLQGFRLSFGHVFRTYDGSAQGFVEASPDGTGWAILPGCIYTNNCQGKVSVDITPAIMPGLIGTPNLRLRWRYKASNDLYWGIDDVQVVSLSPTMMRLSDIEGDRDIDTGDLAIIAANWLSPGPANGADMDNNGTVDIKDFAILAKEWLSLP
ncbi:MAG: C10 family peptidase [Sedimentisphaerales bacterium]|nr:C10 family peptidase [Sedimentisphaerales bacterium]